MGAMKDLILQLREETDSPMMDCKKALIACNNDINRAKMYLTGLSMYHKAITKRIPNGDG